MREIEFYSTRSGRSPVEDFLAQLPEGAVVKIHAALEALRKFDRVSPTHLKKLRGTNGLWEIRVQHTGIAYRLLSFFEGSRLIVVLTAFVKKTERVPVLEIELAHHRQRDYLNRKRQHG
ncbi:type II toxin-antitoxin system RelE/ParE family toxin [Longimicrobium sp.]|uniref:type II toxin-antitoxin system RelE/ParE family toxin n=1 Tax=Longimicrobium sp. TaxID=2029185 RepID=UPI0039C971E5